MAFHAWELLNADDLLLWGESEEELRAMIVRWKSGMESKGLQVNLNANPTSHYLGLLTKVMRCRIGTGQVEKSGVKYLYGVCGKGVVANSIKCIGCVKWIHGNKCSGLAGKL
jgi:hypothetical protein